MRNKFLVIMILSTVLFSSCGPKEIPKPEVQFPGGSQAWIDAPLEGSQLPLAAIEFTAHAASPDGIDSFELNINGQTVANIKPDPNSIDPTLMYMHHTWQPPAPGSYQVEVKAYDRNHQAGPSAKMLLLISLEQTIPPIVTTTSTATATVTAMLTLTPTLADTPTTTATPLPCDLASFEGDITVPDGTDFSPGDTFKKTWRVKNIGSCVWTTDYRIAFVSGNQLDAPASQSLGQEVSPGESVDISIGMRAPMVSGNYKGYWKLRNPQGELFGLVTGGILFVDIDVIMPTTATKATTATSAPLQGCTVRIPVIAGSGIVCKYPCPEGADPGEPCTPP